MMHKKDKIKKSRGNRKAKEKQYREVIYGKDQEECI